MAENPLEILQDWLSSKPTDEKMSIFIAACDDQGFPKTYLIKSISICDDFLKFSLDDKNISNENVSIACYMDQSGKQIRIEGLVVETADNIHSLKIEQLEFWQKGKYRLHDRVLYKSIDKNWESNILYP